MNKQNKPIQDGLITTGTPSGGLYEAHLKGVVEARHKKDGPKVQAAKKSKDGKNFPTNAKYRGRTTKGAKR
jgi:hypothetical protein